MDDQEIGNIFPEDRYHDDDDHKIEDGRKNDVIKDNEESEEDDDDESGDDSENEDGSKKKKKKKINVVAEKKKTRRKVDIFRFKPDMLTNQERGIKFLYENFDKMKLFDKNEKGVFDELKALDKLVHFYKEWHFHFMPKYDYKYFLDRCTEFGKNNLLKTYMNNVRRIHKGEMEWKDLLNEFQDENQQNNNENADNPAAPQNSNKPANNAQPNNQNNNTTLNDTNVSRTIDTNKIPKHIKDIYLPSNSQINKTRVNDSSYARSNNTSRIPIQSQQSQDNSMVDKTGQSLKKKTQIEEDFEEYEMYQQSQQEEEEMKKLREIDDELRILQEEIGKQEQLLGQMDNPYDYDEEDDMEEIKIKKIQKDD